VPQFVTVIHPTLPGQTARMVTPRNGWVPVTEPRTDEHDVDDVDELDDADLDTPAPAGEDTPTAGQSTISPKE
jgi:hypothetical protein